jgi:hypothetical protein
MIERVTFLDLPDCVRIANDTIEVIATTTMGPRLLKCAFLGGPNLFGEYPQLSTSTSDGNWKPIGGHRLWAAPELMPGSYARDDQRIKWEAHDCTIRLWQPTDPAGLEKRMTVTLADRGPQVNVTHELCNRTRWPIEIAAWALTIMRPGGLAILPQPVFRSHDEALRPVRVMALWPFTDLSDDRWSFGRHLITLTARPDRPTPQKIGIRNERGWSACVWPDALFIKHATLIPSATYPDGGVNNEVYTEGAFLELETLGPTSRLEPGESATHAELWSLSTSLDADTMHDEQRLHDAVAAIAAASTTAISET